MSEERAPAARRGPRLRPGDLDPDQRALYDAIAGGPRAAGPRASALADPEGRLEGPFDAMLTAPRTGDALQNLGAVIRWQTSLTSRIRETAILLVAAAAGSVFERTFHEPLAASAGLRPAEIDAIAAGQRPPFGDPAEAAAAVLVSHLIAGHGVLADTDFGAARSALSAGAVFELSTLVGYYQLLSMQLKLFGADRPADPAES